MKPSRGEFWIVNMNPGFRSNPGKTRPVLVIQNNEVATGAYIAIPLTTQLRDDAESLRVKISARDGLIKDSELLISQVTTIDEAKIVKGPIAEATEKEMDEVLKKLVRILS